MATRSTKKPAKPAKSRKAPVKAVEKSAQKSEKHPGGRPTKYTQGVADKICSLIAEGKSVRAIGKMDGLPSSTTIFNWLMSNDKFLEQYTRARDVQADVLADEIIDIADDSSCDTVIDPQSGKPLTDHEAIARSRLRVDARKWIASKLKPKKYGDKIAVGGAEDLPPVRQKVDVTMTPEEAYRKMLDG